jgi:predicted amidohydrolase
MQKRIYFLPLLLLISLFVFAGCQSNSIESSTTFHKTSETNSIQPFKVASIQFNPMLNERDDNVKELLKLTEKAFKNGAKIVVAPEMSTTGYYYANRTAIQPFVDSIPGSTTKKFAELAKRYDAYVVFGMPEVDKKTGLYYNSAALVGPEGYVGKYRKTQMWETEMHWAAWGDLGVPVFDTKYGKIAINICMDSAYFETARLAGIAGANILAFPTNSSAQTISALPARAQQNGMYIISANRSNTEEGFHMVGGSAIWSPYGEKLAEAPVAIEESDDIDKPTITYAEINPELYQNKNKEALKGRRPELYKELMHYVQPWDYTKNETSHEIHAASLQYEPVLENKEKNKQKISKLLEHAKKKNNSLNLVVLPELSLTGPVDRSDRNEIRELAEPSQGESTQFITKLAKKYKVSIIYGFIEENNGDLHNSSLLISEEGKIKGKYQKIHLSKKDKMWAKAGTSLPVFKTKELGTIGILIGEDAVYPEASGVLAVKRADIIAIPSAWHGQFGGKMKINKTLSVNPYPKNSMVTWDSVAMGAQAYTLVSNYVGTNTKYLGGSSLYTLDPLYGLDQPVVASSNREEAIVVTFKTLQKKWWFNQDKLLLSRRTPYYIPVTQ